MLAPLPFNHSCPFAAEAFYQHYPQTSSSSPTSFCPRINFHLLSLNRSTSKGKLSALSLGRSRMSTQPVFTVSPLLFTMLFLTCVLLSQVSAYPLIAKPSDCFHSAYGLSCAFLLTGPVHFPSFSLHFHGLVLSFTMQSLLLLTIGCWSFL